MTRFAQIRGIRMIRWFSASDSIVMTTNTGTYNMAVIDGVRRNWRPGNRSRLVACITGIRAVNMICWFATGNSAVMAAGTNSQYLRMINR